MTAALTAAVLEPLRANPSGSAILLDIDGTLSPIVDNSADATVPEATRQLLIGLSRRYGMVACLSGRRASDARAMVAIGTISYLGSHGAEVLKPGWTEAQLDQELKEWWARIDAFRRHSDTSELRRRHVRIEDKGPIVAYHWRGASNEEDAREAVGVLAAQAQSEGLEVRWGRKVLEVRPPVRIDKGAGVRTLVKAGGYRNVLYAGDDMTDLDAFSALRELHRDGSVQHALCVGVSSEDGPQDIHARADVMVAGTDGVRKLLRMLLADDTPAEF
ncbi:MAG: trehalose-phosphatase [Solirubrobacteraceae bacterium]